MSFSRCCRVGAGLLLMTLPALAASPKSAGAKSTALKSQRHASVKRAGSAGKKSSHAARHSAAVTMPTERATEVQTAPIQQGYLEGAGPECRAGAQARGFGLGSTTLEAGANRDSAMLEG